MRKRLESVRTLFAFWFTTIGGKAFIAFDQIKTLRYLEASIILFLGALVSFIIGNMIVKNQLTVNTSITIDDLTTHPNKQNKTQALVFVQNNED